MFYRFYSPFGRKEVPTRDFADSKAAPARPYATGKNTSNRTEAGGRQAENLYRDQARRPPERPPPWRAGCQTGPPDPPGPEQTCPKGGANRALPPDPRAPHAAGTIQTRTGCMIV